MSEKVVKLSIEKNNLKIERLVDIKIFDPYKKEETDQDRFRGYGFGSFLLFLKPEEIEYKQDVLDFLKPKVDCRYSSMGDLFGFSFTKSKYAVKKEFRLPHICYGSLQDNLLVPQEDCTIDKEIFDDMVKSLEKF